MPYIEVKTAKQASRKQEQLIVTHLGSAMEQVLEKNPKGLMVSVESDVHLYLGGDFMEYAAYVNVVTAKPIPQDKCELLNKVIFELIEQDLKVTKDATYIVYTSPDQFGCKGELL